MLLVASLVALWWSGRTVSTDDPAVAVVPGSPSLLQWRIGQSQRYALRIDSSMRASAQQVVRVRMNGVLDLLTLDVSAGAAQVGLRLSDVELDIGGRSDAKTNRALGVPFRVQFASDGMPESFEFPSEVSAENRGILENLVRTFQITVRDGENWTAKERNASGTYEAFYRRTEPSLVVKTKRSLAGHPSTPIYHGAEIASEETIRTEAGFDWIAEMTVDETIRTGEVGAPALEIINHATLDLQPATPASADPGAWSFAAAAEPATTVPSAQLPDVSVEQARRRIVSEVAALDKAVGGRSVHIHRLRDLLRVDGTLPTVLRDLLRTENLADRTRADLYLVLELAGTEQAQIALTSIIGDPAWSLSDSMRAIVALAGVKQPSADTVDALWNTAWNTSSIGDERRLAAAATFAIGSLGKSMNAAEDPDYVSLSSELLAGATGGADARQRANFALAVGNTRDADLTPGIVGLLADPAPVVRRSAALSLGMLDVDQVADELMSRFEGERSSEVRGAIAESLVSWTAPTAEAMSEIRKGVRAELDENTRYNMARFLGANLTRFPENRSVLRELLRTERSGRIRRYVAESLNRPE